MTLDVILSIHRNNAQLAVRLIPLCSDEVKLYICTYLHVKTSNWWHNNQSIEFRCYVERLYSFQKMKNSFWKTDRREIEEIKKTALYFRNWKQCLIFLENRESSFLLGGMKKAIWMSNTVSSIRPIHTQMCRYHKDPHLEKELSELSWTDTTTVTIVFYTVQKNNLTILKNFFQTFCPIWLTALPYKVLHALAYLRYPDEQTQTHLQWPANVTNELHYNPGGCAV